MVLTNNQAVGGVITIVGFGTENLGFNSWGSQIVSCTNSFYHKEHQQSTVMMRLAWDAIIFDLASKK